MEALGGMSRALIFRFPVKHQLPCVQKGQLQAEGHGLD